ncbi:hypothetical protein [Ruminiclostridium josui]|uniref:hypothetical protein n=1 Tax=Ruminiclostridium josui TaxID=1499 RepID=UPI0006CFB696|nr:hypothetical protein [Ruminiclostridium josui]
MIEKSDEKGYLDIGKSVSVMANYFTDLPMSLHNNSKYDIKIRNIKTNIPDIKVETGSVILKPGEYVDKVLKINRLNNLYDKQVFWLIRPLITYTLGEKEYNFVPPAIYYGILGLNDNRIQEELNKGDF